MKRSRFAMLLMVGTLPLVAMAQNPAQDRSSAAAPVAAAPDNAAPDAPAPGAAPTSPAAARQERLDDQRERRALGAGRLAREISDEEWESALLFFKQHSPERMAALEGLDNSRKRRFRPIIATRYESIQSLEGVNPELHQIKIRQLEIEDQIFALKREHNDVTPKSPEAQKLREQMRQVVAELIQSRVQERKVRINRIQKLLAQEQKKLVEDERRQEQMINRHTEAVLRSDDDPVLNPRELREEPRSPRRDPERDSARDPK